VKHLRFSSVSLAVTLLLSTVAGFSPSAHAQRSEFEISVAAGACSSLSYSVEK
jgi:hypothetical protein